MNDVILSLSHIDKFFGPKDVGVHAVRDLSMTINRGEIIALLGSSGCGKTSILRMIAGFEETSHGTISLMDRPIHKLPPVKRNVAMAFEGYALYPPMTLRDNIGFALKSTKLTRQEITEKVDTVARMLEIDDILDSYPSALSSGQQQRVSLARALVRDADIHLLDEPMGQLEPQLRSLLRGRIKHFIKAHHLTVILVTHDQTEANALADRIAVMDGGVLQQYATSQEIKDSPRNVFTGTFVGEPPMNIFTAQVTQEADNLHCHFNSDTHLSYPLDAFSAQVRDQVLARQKVIIGVRPHAAHRVPSKGVPVQVIANQWLGDQNHIVTNFAGETLVLVEHKSVELRPGNEIYIDLKPTNLHIFDVETGAAIAHGPKLAT